MISRRRLKYAAGLLALAIGGFTAAHELHLPSAARAADPLPLTSKVDAERYVLMFKPPAFLIDPQIGLARTNSSASCLASQAGGYDCTLWSPDRTQTLQGHVAADGTVSW